MGREGGHKLSLKYFEFKNDVKLVCLGYLKKIIQDFFKKTY